MNILSNPALQRSLSFVYKQFFYFVIYIGDILSEAKIYESPVPIK